MKQKTSQAGFTLIELIAVMVILAILAAVVIPRISTVQEGAYESNVKNMYGAIQSQIANHALRAAITGGRGMETYPMVTVNTANAYLDLWIGEYDTDKWTQAREANGGTDENGGGGLADANPDRAIFKYEPHGVGQDVKKDVYFIEYYPASTSSAQDDNYQFDSYQLVAYKDDDNNSGHDCDLVFDCTNDVVIAGMTTYRPEANVDTRAADKE